MVSDAAKLPITTNMGLGNRPPPAKAVAPASKAQPITQSERAMIPTKYEDEQAGRDKHAASSHSWEEDDAEPRAGESSAQYLYKHSLYELLLILSISAVRRAPISNAVFLQAIPCMFVAK